MVGVLDEWMEAQTRHPPTGAKKTATRAAIEVSEVVSLDELDFEGA